VGLAGDVTAAQPALLVGAALACGLMIGIERGWRQREGEAGTRIAGVRTFTLLGGGGGVAALLGTALSPWLTAVLTAAMAAIVVIGFSHDRQRRDATSVIAAILALALGLLAGAGQPALAVATGAVATLLLSMRQELHSFLGRLNAVDVRAFALYAVIAAAVLPFLPDRQMGPLDAWNPFQLWLVIVLVTGMAFAGYVANRTVGATKGVLVTALIGGAYSSTAVTVSLAQRAGTGEQGPFNAGIALASAVMFLRVLALVAILSPATLPEMLFVAGPATIVALGVALLAWVRSAKAVSAANIAAPGNPIALVPAFGFVAVVAFAAVLAIWAQRNFGQSGVATSLFLTGSFDVDAAIITLSHLPQGAIARDLAALALGGTIVANMALKMVLNAVYARRHGLPGTVMLAVSTAVLVVSLLVQARMIGLI
jgi:uncharacterized membrane protein (DUF4010 family)